VSLLAALGGCVSSGHFMYGTPRSVSEDGFVQQFLAVPGVNLTCCVKQDSLGRCVRNKARRDQFIRMTGGPRPGMFVSHIVPLRCGGCDHFANLEWMDEATWKARTGPERHDCGRHPGGSW
jgi:hypothetical protein